jgi:lipoprotein NlpI
MCPLLASRTLVVAACLSAIAARDEPADELLKQARAAWTSGNTKGALETVGRAINADPKNTRALLLRGQMLDALNRSAEAIGDFDRCLSIDPKIAEAYDIRGSSKFKQAKFADAVADFDHFLELRPAQAQGHWRRGIALYYVGRYADGRDQFKGYESVDTNDVENAVWHFLCAAKVDGVDKARAAMLKIGKDSRVPMMQVYDMYRGKLQPADVLSAAEGDKVTPEQRRDRLFYAHLYLGLYFDATGDAAKALEHMELAAGKYRSGHYMGEVARVHADVLRAAASKK